MKLTVDFVDNTRSILAGIKKERENLDKLTPCLAVPEVEVLNGTSAG